jgi:hypothetical protein
MVALRVRGGIVGLLTTVVQNQATRPASAISRAMLLLVNHLMWTNHVQFHRDLPSGLPRCFLTQTGRRRTQISSCFGAESAVLTAAKLSAAGPRHCSRRRAKRPEFSFSRPSPISRQQDFNAEAAPVAAHRNRRVSPFIHPQIAATKDCLDLCNFPVSTSHAGYPPAFPPKQPS